MTRHRHRTNERGAVMVEAAIVAPIVFFLIIAVLEGGLMFRTYLSASNAANNGARTGSITGPMATSDYAIIQSAIKNASAAGVTNLQSIIVYKAVQPGDPPPSDCLAHASGSLAGIPHKCNVYGPRDWTRASSEFGPAGYGGDQYWPATERLHRQSTGSDYIGVYVQMKCKCVVTPLFGAAPNMNAKSIYRIEMDSL